MSNPSRQIECHDALEHLHTKGFSPLLKALERPTTYTSGGRVILAQIAERLKITPKRAASMLREARLCLE